MQSTRLRIVLLWLIGICHVWSLAFMAYGDSPTWDEVGHLAAGICHWRHGDFRAYRVNPPFVRLLAAAPLALSEESLNVGYADCERGEATRPEFTAGRLLARSEGSRYFYLMFLARLCVLPLSVVGAIVSYRWSSELYGLRAGFVSYTMWCASPTVLGYGHLITPDLGAASLFIAAGYSFWKWLDSPTWQRAGFAGVLLGLAELTKSTILVASALWPIIWIAYRYRWGGMTWRKWNREVLVLSWLILCSLLVVNLGYGFEGSFRRLGEFDFQSRLFGGPLETPNGAPALRNRTRGNFIAFMPSVLPKEYVLGLDDQRVDFETHEWSYLNGAWRYGGWWYYYLLAVLYKEPLGSVLLFSLAAVLFVVDPSYRKGASDLVVIFPAVTIFVLVSSQTGFSHHVRYVLPALPFLFIFTSRVMISGGRWQKGLTPLAAGLLIWSIVSSISVFPHSLSYFSEFAGGARNGSRHLGNSNADWGQDLLYVKDWQDAHRRATPFFLAYDLPLINPGTAGIAANPIPISPLSPRATEYSPSYLGPTTGWFAISVNLLHDREHRYDYFNDLAPSDWVGYTTPIYHISLDDANRLRRKYGLHELQAADSTNVEGKVQIAR